MHANGLLGFEEARNGARRLGRSRTVERRVTTLRVALAAFAVISESGFAGATVERIAERSGVARSSIYRHWPSPLPTLHTEALAPLQQRPEDISRTGDARHDLLAYLSHVVDRLNDPTYAAVSLALMAVADTDPAYARAHQDLLASRTQILISLLEDAVASHVICACTDVQFQARLLLAPLRCDRSRGTYTVAPTFETGDERYKRLNSVQAIGQGRYEDGRLNYHMFEVR